MLRRSVKARYALMLFAAAAFALVACSRVTPDADSSALASAPRAASLASAGGDQTSRSVAILAGGCFWGMEDILRKVPGVIDTEVGYTGGTLANPDYDAVSGGSSGHAEAVK